MSKSRKFRAQTKQLRSRQSNITFIKMCHILLRHLLNVRKIWHLYVQGTQGNRLSRKW